MITAYRIRKSEPESDVLIKQNSDTQLSWPSAAELVICGIDLRFAKIRLIRMLTNRNHLA